jgi:hypothetical protein
VGTGGAIVALNTTRGTLGNVTDHGNGTYSATLTAGTVAGDAVVSGTLDGAAIEDSVVVAFRPGEPELAMTTIVSDSASIAANGISSALITVSVFDAYGNLVGRSAGPVELSTSLGLLGEVTDHANGTYTARLTADTLSYQVPAGEGSVSIGAPADTAIVTGTLNGASIPDTTRVEFRHEAAEPMTTTIEADSASIAVHTGATRVTVTLRDAAGNRVWSGGSTVELYTTAGVLTDVVNHGDGTYTAVLQARILTLHIPDAAVVTGTLDGLAIAASAEVTIRRRN